MKLDFKKLKGLVPAIIQDAGTKAVLMLGFMNKEAYQKTASDGYVTFWSRTKNRLWQKGESSGNKLKVVSMSSDCDLDSLLIFVKPEGPTCHSGAASCFDPKNFSLGDLFKLIQTRKKEMPEGSYTAGLFEKGQNEILNKIKEEADEVIVAAESEGKKRLIEESSDLLYHLFVLLVNEKIGVEDIEAELKRRNCIDL